MMNDHKYYRDLLKAHYPGLEIEGTPVPSGQRLVYFARFDDFKREEAEGTKLYPWSSWGAVVLKVSNADDTNWSSRASQEIAILNSFNSDYFTSFHHNEILSFDPETENIIHPKLLITIEERIDGEPLVNLLEDYSSEASVRWLIIELIKGLRLLWEHEHQYVHRDLKPENILVRKNGGIVIIDLGIVREAGQDGLTVTASEFGPCTPAYASPEQAKNDKLNINYKSDIFSLGVLCYFLLTKKNPFVTNKDITAGEVLKNVCELVPPALGELGFNVTDELSRIVEKMMAKQPYQRYRKVNLLLSDLNNNME